MSRFKPAYRCQGKAKHWQCTTCGQWINALTLYEMCEDAGGNIRMYPMPGVERVRAEMIEHSLLHDGYLDSSGAYNGKVHYRSEELDQWPEENPA